MGLENKIAWVTGAGTGIGRAAAVALATEGATVILSGRRGALLEQACNEIQAAGGTAEAKVADVTNAAAAQAVADYIRGRYGRLDILVNNAGTNIVQRAWRELEIAGVDQVLSGNLNSAFYCALAALPIMRARKDGVLIHTASMAGRWVGPLSGGTYTAAKHGMVAMSHSINTEECINGIRSTVVCPGEVVTPILDNRPVPVSAEDRARMLKAEDVADLIRYVALLPPHVCLNEVWITPTWNRGYVAGLARG